MVDINLIPFEFFFTRSNFKEACISRIKEKLSKDTFDIDSLFQDVISLVYVAKSDDELDLAIHGAVRLYEQQKKHNTDKYKLGSNLTRMLSSANKIDKAINIYRNSVIFIFIGDLCNCFNYLY